MHFYLSPFGSSGDVFPMLGLALELQRLGAKVTMATNPHFESRIRENGIAFHSIGTEEDYRRIASHPDLWHPRRSFGYLFENLKPFIEPQYEFFAEAAQCVKHAQCVCETRSPPACYRHCQLLWIRWPCSHGEVWHPRLHPSPATGCALE